MKQVTINLAEWIETRDAAANWRDLQRLVALVPTPQTLIELKFATQLLKDQGFPYPARILGVLTNKLSRGD